MRHLVFGLVMALLLSTSAIGAGPGANAFITDVGSSNVAVIDTATNTVSTMISVTSTTSSAAAPPVVPTHGVAVDPKGARVYVAGASGTPSYVYAIDTASKRVVGSVALASPNFFVMRSPLGLAVTPDGKRLFVTHSVKATRFGSSQGAFSVIDVAVDSAGKVTLALAATVMVGGGSTGVVVSPSGDRVYVANTIHRVSVVNLSAANSAFAVTANVCVEDGSFVGVAVSPDGKYLYAADAGHNTLQVIDTTRIGPMCQDPDPAVVASVNVGPSPYGVAVSPKRPRVFVANSGDNTVSVIDITTPETPSQVRPPVAVGPQGSGPHGVAVASDGSRAYVVNMSDGSFSVLHGIDGHVLFGPIKLRDNRLGVAIAAPAAFGNFVTLDSTIIVTIDIKPGSGQNTINLGSHGVTSVAILSTSTFNAPALVNPATVTLAGAPVQLKGNGNGLPVIEERDVNGDGFVDLVVHVRTDAMVFSPPGNTTAVLEGTTWDDEPIRGEAIVRFVPGK